jgi:hypothetical protein
MLVYFERKKEKEIIKTEASEDMLKATAML